MTLIPTTIAQFKDKAERCCRLARGVNDTVATQRLGDLADEYTVEADKQAANKRQQVAVSSMRSASIFLLAVCRF